MNVPRTPIHTRLALSYVALAAGLMAGSAQAQTSTSASQPAAPQVNTEREKTRARILDITADQAQDLDSAMGLARTLGKDLQTKQKDLAQAKPPSKLPARAQPADGPSRSAAVSVPAPVRAVRRPAPEIADNKPVFTPDFSRQVASFSQLLGQDTIDLPRSDVADGVASTAPVSAETTWGLPDIVAEGLSISPAQKQLQANYEVAQAQKFQARADFFPSVNVSLSRGSTQAEPAGLKDKGYQNHSFRLNQPIYNATIARNFESADLTQQAAQKRLQDGIENVALSLVQATVNVAAARLTINFADAQETQLLNVLRYLETRAQAGAASQVDLNRARTRLAGAKQVRLEQQATYKSALYELERLIEQKPNALRLPFLNQLAGLPATKQELLEIARSNSNSLIALQKDVSSQEAVVASQKARLLPVVSLSLQRDLQKNVNSEETPTAANDRLLGVVGWQMSLGGKEFYASDEAMAELRRRQAELDEAGQRLTQAIESDFAALQSATLRISSAQTEASAAGAVVDAVQTQLQVGRMGDLLEALDATDRLFAARNRQVQALAQQMTAQSQLLRQIGLLAGVAAQAAPTAAQPTVGNPALADAPQAAAAVDKPQ